MTDTPALDPALKAAVDALDAGGVIAYPTEAVWGLGCDPDNERALTALLRLKERDPAKGLILIAGHISQLAPWLEGLPAELHAPLLSSWPGPNTWLVPDNGRSKCLLRGCHKSVAVRVSDHPLVARLCEAYGGPIVSTSANRAGEPPALTAETVRETLGDGLAAILDGPLGKHPRPSTIRDLVSGRVLRD